MENERTATGKACVPTYKIYKKEEFGKMSLQDNRDKMERNQRTAVEVIRTSKCFHCFAFMRPSERALDFPSCKDKSEQN